MALTNAPYAACFGEGLSKGTMIEKESIMDLLIYLAIIDEYVVISAFKVELARNVACYNADQTILDLCSAGF